MGRFVSVAIALGAFSLGISAPQSAVPLRQQELEEGIGELRRSMSDVAISLFRVQRDDINDEALFFEGQRRRLRGILALVRCVESVNDVMPPSRDKTALAACLRTVSGELSLAAQRVRSLQSANDHGHSLFATKAFQPFDKLREQPNLGVAESVAP